ncbi:MAG TPA: hypothetical protein VM308_02110 [Sphingomicrobium sp.]|nr:hypothetical protein [Sphingomicrobium sp.]
MMNIFEMRNLGGIEAVVLAPDYDRAHELFEQHLVVHGGDPDALLYRQVGLEHLRDEVAPAVEEALGIGRDGLVACDATGQWVFLTPLGDRKQAGPG